MSDMTYDQAVWMDRLGLFDQPMREGSYQLGDGRSVYYDDGPETLRDATDLYTVLDELHGTGSPNLENMQARHILDRLQTGAGLGEVHIGTLRALMDKHKAKIAALRRSPDRKGQDFLKVASPGPESRMIPASGARESGSDPIRLGVLLREATTTRTGAKAYETTIVREGPGNAADARFYTKQALRDAVAAGRFDGLQAYLNHPSKSEAHDRPERDVRYLAGHFKEARFVDGNPAEVRAKFIAGGMHKDQVVSLIESALDSPQDKPLVGISIDGFGDTDKQLINGRQHHVVRKILQLGSADIVTKAGAGGRFIRRLEEAFKETRHSRDQEATMEEFEEPFLKVLAPGLMGRMGMSRLDYEVEQDLREARGEARLEPAVDEVGYQPSSLREALGFDVEDMS